MAEKRFRGLRIKRSFRRRATDPVDGLPSKISLSEMTTESEFDDESSAFPAAVVTPMNGDIAHPSGLEAWNQSLNDLLRSKEMQRFVSSSANLVQDAWDITIRTALLPVTLPIKATNATASFAMHSCTQAVDFLQDSGVGGVVQALVGLPAFVLDVSGQTCGTMGSLLLGGLLAQPQKHKQIKSMNMDSFDYESEDERLDRLRLDFSAENLNPKSSKSEFLLRVDDIALEATGKDVMFVDIKSCDSELLEEALGRLVRTGLSLIANHPTVRLGRKYSTTCSIEIHWKPEGKTLDTMRSMIEKSTLERLRMLQTTTLVWSGSCTHSEKAHGRKAPFYVARGVIEMPVENLLHLLWDNSRTTEYNNFCLGRKNTLVLEDKVLEGASQGTKAICSETRVPMTNMSVFVNCMMHARALDNGEGFVILSRSLDRGKAGLHHSRAHVDKNSGNEILWGLNIMRRIPNHPHLVDLTSISQVGSSLVPKFLASKIAMMGVHEFFENVRSKAKKV